MIAQEIKLLNLLSNNNVTFFIPPYQRNYEWAEEQCKVFLEDVQKTCDSNASGTIAEHFFGTITYFQTETKFGQPNRLVLIDGQQRITTTMLFLIAMRDLMKEEDTKAFINARYLKNDNVSGDVEYKIKLKQVETDWGVFKKLVLSQAPEDTDKTSVVYRNYKFFYNRLSAYQKAGGDLGNLIDKGLNKFSVITIQLEPDRNPWENPQEIFESMNSLGKPLSLADLVRNYLLMGLDPGMQDELYSKYWMKIERLLPGRVSDFIRDYMQGHEQRSFITATEKNYKKLYSTFKQIFSYAEPRVLLQDLAESAELICEISASLASIVL